MRINLGAQWIAEITVIIWQHVLQLWESRNGDEHGLTQEEKEKKTRQKLRSKELGLYAVKD